MTYHESANKPDIGRRTQRRNHTENPAEKECRMTTIVLFDDDPRSIAVLRKLVEERLPAGEPCSILEATSLDELQALLAEGTQVDILITDIVMPDGEPSGIEVVQRFFPAGSGTQVIYVSGYLEQAPEVYQTSHLYFLLKPIDADRLEDALNRAFTCLSASRPPMLRIKSGHKAYLINTATIMYLSNMKHRVTIHCRKQNFETYTHLDDLQEQLPAGFSRCHRSYLVNLAYVSSLKESEVILHDGTTLPVSRRRARQTQHDLLKFIGQQAKSQL